MEAFLPCASRPRSYLRCLGSYALTLAATALPLLVGLRPAIAKTGAGGAGGYTTVFHPTSALGNDTTATPADSIESEGRHRPPLHIEGSTSLLLEGYRANGIAGRRAPGSARLSADASFDLLGLRSGLTFLYSTDRSGLRQSADRFSYSGHWRFLTLEAGDLSPAISEYGLNGVTLRGGHIDLRPGPLILTFAGGRTQRAVSPDDNLIFHEGAYRRSLFVARAGFERGDGTLFTISGLMARDDTTSIAPGARVAPKENISLSPELRLSLIGGRLQFEADGTLSAITGDTRAAELDLSDTALPGFLTNLLKLRPSTRMDFATRLGADLNLNTFGLRTSYERVQPGFESLGLAQQRSDQEMVQFRPRLTLLQHRLSLDGSYSTARNNLLGQSSRTVHRQQIGGSVRARFSRAFSLTSTMQQIENASRPDEPGSPGMLGDLRQVARSITLTPTLSLVGGPLVHTMMLSISSQAVDDRSDATVPAEIRAAYASSGSTVTTTYALAFPSGLSLNTTGSHSRTEAASYETRMSSVTVGAGHALLERRLTLNATGGWSTALSRLGKGPPDPSIPDRRTRQLTTTLSSAYRLPGGNSLRLTLRAMHNGAVAGAATQFSEFFSTLQFERRF